MEKEELKKKIEELTALKNELKNEEQAVKLTMNSIYGAIGNNWFACFNPEVAEAVTLQGQDLIKHSEKILHKYFHEYSLHRFCTSCTFNIQAQDLPV